MKRPFLSIVGLCAAAISLAAMADGAETRPHPAVARIVAPEGRATSFGSGTLVAVNEQHGLVVTNWHVIRDARGPVHVVFPNGFHSPATILDTDEDWDLAALAIWRPNISPISLAPEAPRLGEPLWIAGYGQGAYRMSSGRCVQYVSPGKRFPSQMLEVSTSARNGDSGGPILNARGELAGVLFGTSFGTTTGSYCGRVSHFLSSVNDDFRALPDAPNNVAPPLESDSTMLADLPPTEWVPADEISTPPRSPLPQPTAIAVEPTAALASNQSTSSVSLAGPDPGLPSGVPLATDTPLVWSDIVGRTRADQIKSVLALIGAIALLMQAFRVLTPAPATGK